MNTHERRILSLLEREGRALSTDDMAASLNITRDLAKMTIRGLLRGEYISAEGAGGERRFWLRRK